MGSIVRALLGAGVAYMHCKAVHFLPVSLLAVLLQLGSTHAKLENLLSLLGSLVFSLYPQSFFFSLLPFVFSSILFPQLYLSFLVFSAFFFPSLSFYFCFSSKVSFFLPFSSIIAQEDVLIIVTLLRDSLVLLLLLEWIIGVWYDKC